MLKDIVTYFIIKIIYSFDQLVNAHKIPELCLGLGTHSKQNYVCPNKALSLMGDTDINQIITQTNIKLHLLQIKGHLSQKTG